MKYRGSCCRRFANRITKRDLDALTIADTAMPYDGDGHLLRLGLQAYSLGIAYEFDPYFGLSISRVDPLVNGGAKRDHRDGVKRDHLAAAGLSP